MSPIFSIIVPVFNVEDYLEEAINSLLEQTYNDFEIILVNDGSTDLSGEICKIYARDNNKVLLIEQENKGVSEARNIGTKYASGQFIYYFDSDDILDENSLSYWYYIFKNTNADVVLFEGEPFGVNCKNLNYRRSKGHYNKILKSNEFIYDSKVDSTYTPQPCLFVVKACIAKKNIFYPKIIHEDQLYYAKLLLRDPVNIYVSPGAFFKRRVRAGSIMTTIKSDKNFLGYERVLREILLDDKILNNKKAVHLIINDLIRQMCNIAIEVDGGILSLNKRISLFNIFWMVFKSKRLSKTCFLCVFPELKRFR